MRTPSASRVSAPPDSDDAARFPCLTTGTPAAATTIAAAFGTHLAARQHQRIAASYAATADQLERLIVGVDVKTASADRQAQFVADVERVLAAQNEGWVDLLSTATKT